MQGRLAKTCPFHFAGGGEIELACALSARIQWRYETSHKET